MHGTDINICLLGVNFSYDKSLYFRWMMCDIYRPREKQNHRINGKYKCLILLLAEAVYMYI